MLFPVFVFAAEGSIEVIGKMYEFDKDSHYEFSESKDYSETNGENTYGNFSVNGNITNIEEKEGVPAYQVEEGNLNIFYNYGERLFKGDKDSWHLISDKGKKLDSMKLDDKILNGTILLQTSNDRKKWVDVKCINNAFEDIPIRTDVFYSTEDVQLINGCFYRAIVVYELETRTKEGKILFVKTDKYEYKKCAEIYEFYAYTNEAESAAAENNEAYSLGNKSKVREYEGYYGEKTIEKGDLHYGWDLGNFFVSGYTDKIMDSEGDVVFLKNVGDKVTLWFRLDLAKSRYLKVNLKREVLIDSTEGLTEDIHQI